MSRNVLGQALGAVWGEDPGQAAALLALWALFLGGTVAFLVVDLALATVSLSYWPLGPVLVTVVGATVAVGRDAR